MGKFISGFLTGTIATAAVVAGFVVGVKKTIIEPIEEQELKVDQNRKKALRKRVTR